MKMGRRVEEKGAWGIREAVAAVIENLGDSEGNDVKGLQMPELEDVEVEWTGFRAGVSAFSPRPEAAEREQYERMMEEVEESSPSIIYFHGGAFWYFGLLTFFSFPIQF
jgi:hypothetical protein